MSIDETRYASLIPLGSHYGMSLLHLINETVPKTDRWLSTFLGTSWTPDSSDWLSFIFVCLFVIQFDHILQILLILTIMSSVNKSIWTLFVSKVPSRCVPIRLSDHLFLLCHWDRPCSVKHHKVEYSHVTAPNLAAKSIVNWLLTPDHWSFG